MCLYYICYEVVWTYKSAGWSWVKPIFSHLPWKFSQTANCHRLLEMVSFIYVLHIPINNSSIPSYSISVYQYIYIYISYISILPQFDRGFLWIFPARKLSSEVQSMVYIMTPQLQRSQELSYLPRFQGFFFAMTRCRVGIQCHQFGCYFYWIQVQWPWGAAGCGAEMPATDVLRYSLQIRKSQCTWYNFPAWNFWSWPENGRTHWWSSLELTWET